MRHLFRRRTSRAALYERLLAEKDKQIARLDAEITLLRTGNLPLRYIPPGPVADGKPAELGSATWESDLDEATDILNKNGLSQIHLAEILDGLGVGSSDLS